MEHHIVKILSTDFVTHNVKRIRLEKPEGYVFIPGQATDVAINQEEWKNEKRPFTFTALNEKNYLEFTIKIYDDHNGVTHQLGKLKKEDTLIIHDVWGAIQYNGEGTFIAGGAGVTPFIAILRQLNVDGKVGNNKLLFSNKTAKDIILKDEFEQILGDNFINTLTDEKTAQYDNRMIDKDYLKENISDFSKNFYICGPPPMIDAVKKDLVALGAKDTVITVEM